MKKLIDCAMGRCKSELVLKNANFINVFSGKIENGDIAIKNGKIIGIGNYQGETEIDVSGKTVLPGYIDGHMHIESTQLTPEELAKAIVPRGTTTIIADPHEIANVCGMDGIEYIAKASKNLPLDVMIQLPSCVPATPFENSGAVLSSKEIKENINNDYILGLGEFMNYPGVIYNDDDVIKKLETAQNLNKVVDGHAPNLKGTELNAYLLGGITTDHECTNVEEMQLKIDRGMYVHLREGSATRNTEVNCKGITEGNMRRCILCTDDRHACDLKTSGHIDNNLRLLIKCGISPVWAVTMATLNNAECYGLKWKGAIAPNYIADLVVVSDLKDFNAELVIKNGKIVAKDRKALFTTKQFISDNVLSTVHIKDVKADDFKIKLKGKKAKVIRLLPKNVVTEKVVKEVESKNGDVIIKGTDFLKLSVIERHKATGNIGLGLIEGYGLKNGAIALTVSHDSHNIIVLGDDNEAMAKAVMEIKKIGGGMVIADNNKIISSMPLEIAGLITKSDITTFETELSKMIKIAFNMGVTRDVQPFMSLSFLALVVIPELKITDRGLFDVSSFSFTEIDE
jgi:adenine deaminase